MPKNNAISRLETIQTISWWIFFPIIMIYLINKEWLGGGLLELYLLPIAVICAVIYIYTVIKIPNAEKDQKIRGLQEQIKKLQNPEP